MSTFSLGDHGLDFKINNTKAKDDLYIFQYDNDFGGNIEVNVNYSRFCELVSIDGYSLGDIQEAHIVEPNKETLKKAKAVTHEPPSEEAESIEYLGEFRAILDQDKFELLFGEQREPKVYAESDRIEFYYDEKLRPVSIMVKNLTPEEYSTLKRYVVRTVEPKVEEPIIHKM